MMNGGMDGWKTLNPGSLRVVCPMGFGLGPQQRPNWASFVWSSVISWCVFFQHNQIVKVLWTWCLMKFHTLHFKPSKSMVTTHCFKPRPWRCCPKPVGSPSEVWIFCQRPRVVSSISMFEMTCNSIFFWEISQNAWFELHPCKFCLLPLTAYIPQVKPWVFCNPTTKKQRWLNLVDVRDVRKLEF